MSLKVNGTIITSSTTGYFTLTGSNVVPSRPTYPVEGSFGFSKTSSPSETSEVYTGISWDRLKFVIPVPSPVSFTLQQDTGISASDGITNNGTILVSGINVINGSWQYSTNSGNNWSPTLPVSTSSFVLPADTYAINSIHVRQTNAVGYSSTTTNTSQIIVDTTAPTVVINPVSSDDILTYADVDTTAITGTVSDTGSAVTLTFGSINRSTSVSGNNWTYTVTEADLEALGEGSGKIITASATDLAGNTGSISRTVRVNTWGSAWFISPTTTTWTPPLPGIKKVHVAAIGGGSAGIGNYGAGTTVYSGAGGGYGYKNNIPVTYGTSYTVVVGGGGTAANTANSTGNGTYGGAGGNSYFISTSIVCGNGASGSYAGASYGSSGYPGTGGGYVGYSGYDGEDGVMLPYGGTTSIQGGSAGGNPGAKGANTTSPSGNCGGGGGSSAYGLTLPGANGGVGYRNPDNSTTGVYYAGDGGLFGGGGGGRHGGNRPGVGGDGAGGAVTIVWGVGRSLPYTTFPTSSDFTTPGTHVWVAPPGVTSVCAVCIGAGGAGMGNWGSHGGGGGGLGWRNNISVVPGSSYTVFVGKATDYQNGEPSYFISTSTVAGLGGTAASGTTTPIPGYGGGYNGTGGGRGGNGFIQVSSGAGGGGAGGYSGNGGNGGDAQYSPTAGQGGGGGGGFNTSQGGGVGIYGQGPSGNAGTSWSPEGSPGSAQFGPVFGSGSGAERIVTSSHGAVRLVWGPGRAFPSTNVGPD